MAQYKEITIKTNRTDTTSQPVSQLYKGTSTVNQNSKSFALYDTELIKQDILNHFNIRKGEKIYNADFGTVVWNTLYEPLTQATRELIEEDIKSILDSDPRIVVQEINIIEKEFGIQLAVELEFQQYSQVEKILFNFDRENGISMQ